MQVELDSAQPSARMRQDARDNEGIPNRSASTGRMFLGYCLSLAAPAICWMLEDLGADSMSARMISLSVLVGGVLLTSVGSMARWGYDRTSEHHFFGI